MKTASTKINLSLQDEFKRISRNVDQLLIQYTIKVREHAHQWVPKDRETLLKETKFERVSLHDYVVYSNVDYAVDQYDKVLHHLGRPGQSISALYKGVGRKIYNELANTTVGSGRRIRRKGRTFYERGGVMVFDPEAEKVHAEKKSIERNEDYDYKFGLAVLKGWKPKRDPWRKFAVKKGSLIKYKADWFNETLIEKDVGSINEFIEKNLAFD